MTIIYVKGLGQHVAIEHDRVVDADRNRDALVERVGEATASSADIIQVAQSDRGVLT